MLQNLRLIDAFIARAGHFRMDRTPERLQWLIRIAAYQKVFLASTPDYAIGDQTVRHARLLGGERAARFANAVVRRLLADLPASESEIEPFWRGKGYGELPPAVRYSAPDEIARALADGYGSATCPNILRALNDEKPRVWLRANRLKASIERLAERLAAEGCRTESVSDAPKALIWKPDSLAPWKTECWARGEVTVQDLAAQLAVELIHPVPGDTVIDWCAAPGGKTGQIWEAMNGRGSLTALETDPERRDTLKTNLERLYGPDHGIAVVKSAKMISSNATLQRSQCNVLLLDVPCMGFGLLRRHPESRWDDRWSRRAAMRRLQSRILAQSSPHLVPGGRLIWVTCSPTRFENEELIHSWLEEAPRFRGVDPGPLLPSWAAPWTQIDGYFVRTRPDCAPIDGFCLCVLERR